MLFQALGGEFMPKLEEGNLWIRATLPTSISLEQSSKYVGRMRAILRGCPDGTTGAVAPPCTEDNRRHTEVLTVISQLGRPDDGTRHRTSRKGRRMPPPTPRLARGRPMTATRSGPAH